MEHWIILAPQNEAPPSNENAESAWAKNQFEHYLKLIDVFETRQTWVFNFAILVYIGAMSASGPVLEHIVQPALDAFAAGKLAAGSAKAPFLDSLVFTCVGLYSVLLPLLMLPLCYLYIDVSIFGSALNATTLPAICRNEYIDPGGLALNWIKKAGFRKLDIQRFAHGRTALFLLAPVSGLVVAAAGIILGALYRESSWWPQAVIGASVCGFVISAVALIETQVARQQAREARDLSHDAREKSIAENSSRAKTAAGVFGGDV